MAQAWFIIIFLTVSYTCLNKLLVLFLLSLLLYFKMASSKNFSKFFVQVIFLSFFYVF